MRTLLQRTVFLALAACSGGDDDDGTPNRTDDILALTGDPVAGEASYEANCTVCHAADGSGGTGPAIAGAGAEAVVEAMLYPEGSMPAFDTLGDQELADLAAYTGEL